jgi:hypothetical protein
MQYSQMVREKFKDIVKNMIAAKKPEDKPLGHGIDRAGFRDGVGAMMDKFLS